MANLLQYSTTVRNAQLDAITTAIGTSGFCDIYSGTAPANVGTAISGQTLLAHLPLSSAFAAGASSGVLTANAISADTSADATGTPSFFRLTTSGGTAVVQGTAGASSCDLNISGLSGGQIIAGGNVACSSATITAANS